VGIRFPFAVHVRHGGHDKVGDPAIIVGLAGNGPAGGALE